MNNYINKLPDELYKHIRSFIGIGDDLMKYEFSVIWCNSCGEILKNGNWYISMGQCQSNTFINYTCPLCNNHNIYFEPSEWMTLLDYIDEKDTP